MRGESKYHYVNFSLKDDQPQLHEIQTQQPITNFNDANFAQSFKYVNHNLLCKFIANTNQAVKA